MKKLLYYSITAIITVGLAAFTAITVPTEAAAGELGPTVVVASPMVKMDGKATISILGCGFTPGQEINLLFADVNGIPTNIGDDLKPEPKVNERGAWYATWSCGRWVSRGLIEEGAYVFTVTDSDYSPLAQAGVAFYEAKEEKKK